MPNDKQVQTEQVENEALDATELDDESLEDAAGGGDIRCNTGCDDSAAF